MTKIKYRILQAICENPSISPSEISNKVKLTKPVISIYLKKLEKEGFVLKYFGIGKRIKVHPTAKGVRKYKEIKLLIICGG